MALELRSQGKHVGIGHRVVAADDQCSRQQDAGHDRCGRGPEASPMGDAIGADQFQSPWLTAEPLEHELHRPSHQMRAVTRNLVGALARDVDDQAVLADTRQHVVVPVQGKAESVEAGTEVGAGGRNANVDRSGSKRRPSHVRPARDVTRRRDCRPAR